MLKAHRRSVAAWLRTVPDRPFGASGWTENPGPPPTVAADAREKGWPLGGKDAGRDASRRDSTAVGEGVVKPMLIRPALP